jgi:eukaryotic-like serine/threonine-protein kinase
MSIPRSNSSPRLLVFGPFAFDSVSGELSKHNVRLRLQGQPLQILTALVLQPGTIVTRDEFQQRLWKDSTFVDFEHGLNAAMNRLRQVLGDAADRPRYIETLPSKGYRFIAPIQEAGPNPVVVMTPSLEQVETAPRIVPARGVPEQRNWPRWILPVVLLAGLNIGYLAGTRSPTGTTAPLLRFGISPPVGYAFEAGSSRQTFALSPDGRYLAFSAMNASGMFQTFLRKLDEPDARPVADSLGAYHVFWAPDSLSLFQTVKGSVRRTALDGDSYQVLCDMPALMLTGALVGPNLLISARSANYVVPAAGGTPQAAKELYPWPQMLPDGKHLLYTAFDARTGHHRAQVVIYGEPGSARDLIETDSRTLYAPSAANPEIGYLVTVRAGNILAFPFDPRSLRVQGEPFAVVSRTYSFSPTGAADFSVSNNGLLAYRRYLSRSQLAWVDRRGETVRPVGPANVNLKGARISPDGTKIATAIFDVDRGVKDLWIIDAVTGDARKMIAGPGSVDNPVWAPDSKKLAFSRAYEAPPQQYLLGLGDQDVEEALPATYFQEPGDWSPDGRFLAFTNTAFAAADNELKGDVWLVDMARGRKVIHLISTPFHEANPAFSPDGRWLAYTSNESGRTELYVQAFESGETPSLVGERHLVSRQGALALRWRRDGKELVYLAGDGQLYAVPIGLSPTLKIGTPVPLFAISLEARAAVHAQTGFDVSADGQRLLIPVVTSAQQSEIIVIQHWEEMLRRGEKPK